MVCTSIIYKLRHTLKIFISYLSFEIRVSSFVSILLLFIFSSFLLAF